MKKNLKRGFVLIVILTMGVFDILYAQSLYNIKVSKDLIIKLSGTSTLHNWDMKASSFNSDANFGFKQGNASQLTSLKSLTFTLVVLNLQSGEKGLDKNAYKALKADQYKNIYYKLTASTVMPGKDSKYLIKTEGDLNIAGITKKITMDVYCTVNNDATISCTGSDKLNMSDYEVKPPAFMFGAMKTGDALTLDFTLVYKKQTAN